MSALSPLTTQPQHVSDSIVYDFDMFMDPALVRDPHERVRDLLQVAPPIFWTPRNGGHWVVTGFRENYDASRDTDTFQVTLCRLRIAALCLRLCQEQRTFRCLLRLIWIRQTTPYIGHPSRRHFRPKPC